MQLEKVVVEDVSPVRKRVQIEVPAAEVQGELERAYASVGRDARIRGFRPGRVPRAVIERMYGDQIRREVLSRLVEHSFHHAIESERLDVVGTPEIDADGLTPGESLTYFVTIDVRPQIVVGETRGLEVERPVFEVTDDDVERAIASMRESAAQLRPIDDRVVVESGDVVTVDVTASFDGREPQTRSGVLVEAGGGSFSLALERQLVGLRIGDRKTLEVPYPADYGNPSLAGKTIPFDVLIGALKTKELPPLDDDFARDHARADSLADLRARVRADLERQATAHADAVVRDAIVGQLVDRHPFDVPASLVTRRSDALLASLDVRIPDGAEGEQVLERLRAEVRPRAEREVRGDLVLDAVMASRGIGVEESDVDAEIESLAALQKQAPERIRAVYERREARHALRARIGRERALAAVLADAKVVPRAVPKDVARAE